MYDFELVAFGDFYVFPIFFSDDVFIKLDRDALLRQRKMPEQFLQIQFAGYFLRFAVNENFHALIQNPKSEIASSLRNHAPDLGFFALAHGADENCGAPGFKLRQLQMHDRNSITIGFGVKNQRAEA